MIENLAYYICFTNHNHYNFADSVRQHYKKTYRNRNFFNLDLNKGTLFGIFLICSGRWL